MSRTYWRSLAEIENRPEFRAALEREFPEGASELPEGITRREMMMLVGASLSLAGLAGCIRRPVEEIVPYVTAPEEIVPGIPRYYATTMPFRRSAYGLIVESHEGRPTKIEGNPLHPGSLGATDVFAQAAILGLYDPDRSQTLTHLGEIRPWSAFLGAIRGALTAQQSSKGAGIRLLVECIDCSHCFLKRPLGIGIDVGSVKAPMRVGELHKVKRFISLLRRSACEHGWA